MDIDFNRKRAHPSSQSVQATTAKRQSVQTDNLITGEEEVVVGVAHCFA